MAINERLGDPRVNPEPRKKHNKTRSQTWRTKLARILFFETGISTLEAAEVLGLTRQTMSVWWKEYGVIPPHRGGQGSRPKSPLIEAQRKIAELEATIELLNQRVQVAERDPDQPDRVLDTLITSLENVANFGKVGEVAQAIKAVIAYKEDVRKRMPSKVLDRPDWVGEIDTVLLDASKICRPVLSEFDKGETPSITNDEDE